MPGKKKNRKVSQSSVPGDPEPGPESSNWPDGKAQERLLNFIASLHLNSEYSDLEIICKACFGEFKETREPIRLDNTDAVLLEKVLEFQYTGNYSVGRLIPETQDPQLNCDTGLEEATDEITIHSSEIIAQDPMRGSDQSDREDAVESVIDPSAECHPCYFHMRVFGEADYFMISPLKDKAREQFPTSFTDCSEKDLFAEVIKELYSERANYQELKTLAIDVVVDNLPSLREGFSTAIDSELLEAVPKFAVDLCLATMDKYVSEPPNMKPYPFATGLEYKGVGYNSLPWDFRNN
ncbi:uncharacterized protein BJX67DRAFT_376056 [Aspergillus lucknowensis]|uniref:BTB domain-containing protein n=1 Tax=Aspergillus lucknowensis TaxID=176173 RepID=A0ABR4L8H0_9EURO